MSAPALTLVRSTRSIMGGGTATIDTFTDEAGNEWTSVGGGAPVLTKTAADIARSADFRAMVARSIALERGEA